MPAPCSPRSGPARPHDRDRPPRTADRRRQPAAPVAGARGRGRAAPAPGGRACPPPRRARGALSGGDFVPGSAAPGNGFTAASDFNTVAVSIVDPGTPLRGTKTLQAIPTSQRETDHVTFQPAP